MSTIKDGLISFRGIKEGIYIYVKEGDHNNIKIELVEKLKESMDFFKGANILGIKGENLSQNQKEELLQIIEKEYNLSLSDQGLPTHLESSSTYEDVTDSMTKFVNSTIRSGQMIEYDGSIVIIGDVNPGALIRAKGNIVILGTLMGVAHAGMDGNDKAIVAAYDLQPTQLRIGNIIGRKPDDGGIALKLPEIARSHNGEVLIEPYLPKNNR